MMKGADTRAFTSPLQARQPSIALRCWRLAGTYRHRKVVMSAMTICCSICRPVYPKALIISTRSSPYDFTYVEDLPSRDLRDTICRCDEEVTDHVQDRDDDKRLAAAEADYQYDLAKRARWTYTSAHLAISGLPTAMMIA